METIVDFGTGHVWRGASCAQPQFVDGRLFRLFFKIDLPPDAAEIEFRRDVPPKGMGRFAQPQVGGCFGHVVDGGKFVRHGAGDLFGRMQKDLQRVLFAWSLESYVKFPWNERIIGGTDFFAVENDIREAVDGVEGKRDMACEAVGRRECPFIQPVMAGVFTVGFGIFAVERLRFEAVAEKIEFDVSWNVRLNRDGILRRCEPPLAVE